MGIVCWEDDIYGSSMLNTNMDHKHNSFLSSLKSYQHC